MRYIWVIFTIFCCLFRQGAASSFFNNEYLSPKSLFSSNVDIWMQFLISSYKSGRPCEQSGFENYILDNGISVFSADQEIFIVLPSQVKTSLLRGEEIFYNGELRILKFNKSQIPYLKNRLGLTKYFNTRNAQERMSVIKQFFFRRMDPSRHEFLYKNFVSLLHQLQAKQINIKTFREKIHYYIANSLISNDSDLISFDNALKIITQFSSYQDVQSFASVLESIIAKHCFFEKATFETKPENFSFFMEESNTLFHNESVCFIPFTNKMSPERVSSLFEVLRSYGVYLNGFRILSAKEKQQQGIQGGEFDQDISVLAIKLNANSEQKLLDAFQALGESQSLFFPSNIFESTGVLKTVFNIEPETTKIVQRLKERGYHIGFIKHSLIGNNYPLSEGSIWDLVKGKSAEEVLKTVDETVASVYRGIPLEESQKAGIGIDKIYHNLHQIFLEEGVKAEDIQNKRSQINESGVPKALDRNVHTVTIGLPLNEEIQIKIREFRKDLLEIIPAYKVYFTPAEYTHVTYYRLTHPAEGKILNNKEIDEARKALIETMKEVEDYSIDFKGVQVNADGAIILTGIPDSDSYHLTRNKLRDALPNATSKQVFMSHSTIAHFLFPLNDQEQVALRQLIEDKYLQKPMGKMPVNDKSVKIVSESSWFLGGYEWKESVEQMQNSRSIDELNGYKDELDMILKDVPPVLQERWQHEFPRLFLKMKHLSASQNEIIVALFKAMVTEDVKGNMSFLETFLDIFESIELNRGNKGILTYLKQVENLLRDMPAEKSMALFNFSHSILFNAEKQRFSWDDPLNLFSFYLKNSRFINEETMGMLIRARLLSDYIPKGDIASDYFEKISSLIQYVEKEPDFIAIQEDVMELLNDIINDVKNNPVTYKEIDECGFDGTSNHWSAKDVLATNKLIKTVGWGGNHETSAILGKKKKGGKVIVVAMKVGDKEKIIGHGLLLGNFGRLQAARDIFAGFGVGTLVQQGWIEGALKAGYPFCRLNVIGSNKGTLAFHDRFLLKAGDALNRFKNAFLSDLGYSDSSIPFKEVEEVPSPYPDKPGSLFKFKYHMLGSETRKEMLSDALGEYNSKAERILEIAGFHHVKNAGELYRRCNDLQKNELLLRLTKLLSEMEERRLSVYFPEFYISFYSKLNSLSKVTPDNLNNVLRELLQWSRQNKNLDDRSFIQSFQSLMDSMIQEKGISILNDSISKNNINGVYSVLEMLLAHFEDINNEPLFEKIWGITEVFLCNQFKAADKKFERFIRIGAGLSPDERGRNLKKCHFIYEILPVIISGHDIELDPEFTLKKESLANPEAPFAGIKGLSALKGLTFLSKDANCLFIPSLNRISINRKGDMECSKGFLFDPRLNKFRFICFESPVSLSGLYGEIRIDDFSTANAVAMSSSENDGKTFISSLRQSIVKEQKGMVIKIGGLSGTGKSTLARLTAKNGKMFFLSTGNIFRTIALAAINESIDYHTPQGLKQLEKILNTSISLRTEEGDTVVLFNGENVESMLEKERARIETILPKMNIYGMVAEWMKQEIKRSLSEGVSVVIEGRPRWLDRFPFKGMSFYLESSPGKIALRRADDYIRSKGLKKAFITLFPEEAINFEVIEKTLGIEKMRERIISKMEELIFQRDIKDGYSLEKARVAASEAQAIYMNSGEMTLEEELQRILHEKKVWDEREVQTNRFLGFTRLVQGLPNNFSHEDVYRELVQVVPEFRYTKQGKKRHIANVIIYLAKLGQHDFDYFWNNLEESVRQKTDKNKYFEQLEILYSWLSELSPNERDRFYSSVILHDYGFVVSGKAVDHMEKGEETISSFLNRLNLDGSTANEIKRFIGRHCLFGDIGVRQLLPQQLLPLSEVELKKLCIMASLDAAGWSPRAAFGNNQPSNKLQSHVISAFLSYSDPVQIKELCDSYFKERLQKLIRKSFSHIPSLSEIEKAMEVLKTTFGEQEYQELERLLGTNIVLNNINLFMMIAQNDTNYFRFAKFLKLFFYLDKLLLPKEKGMKVWDFDIDQFDTEGKEIPVAVKRFLTQVDQIPEHFSLGDIKRSLDETGGVMGIPVSVRENRINVSLLHFYRPRFGNSISKKINEKITASS